MSRELRMTPLAVHLTGPHAHLSPLSRAEIAEAMGGEIFLTASPDAADVLVFSHILDLQTAALETLAPVRSRATPVAILSEEPFFDTVWAREPATPLFIVETEIGPLEVAHLTHATTAVFAFDKVPYVPLADPRIRGRYVAALAESAERGPSEWMDHWSRAPVDTLFLLERRRGSQNDASWPDHGITGLSGWRTRLAEAVTGDGVVRRGRGWGMGDNRFGLEDWHADKLESWAGRVHRMSAIENTLAPDYVTEKVFDAFACGAVPIVHAGPDHALWRIGVAPEAVIDLAGLDPSDAALTLPLRGADPDAYAATQARLLDWAGDTEAWQAEVRRIAKATAAVLRDVANRRWPG